jgi:hypothetical protein
MGSSLGKVVKVASLGTIDPNKDADAAAKEAQKAAGVAAKGQQNALAYQQQVEKLPLELRDKILPGLAGMYGVKGYENQAMDLTGISEKSPIYQAMLAQINQGLTEQQNATGAQASAGGFLRSGVMADALAKQQAQAGVSRANALSSVYQNYLGGVTGLAGMPLNTQGIANTMAGIGQTQAQGITGAEQIRQAGYQNTQNTIMGGAQGLLAAFSDIRLKDNIRYVGDIGAHRWYEWEWNEKARELGLEGTGGGVMAHEVEKYAPAAIGESNGYMTVNYDALRLH